MNRLPVTSNQCFLLRPAPTLDLSLGPKCFVPFGELLAPRKDHWAAYVTDPKIEVKYEPEVGMPIDARFRPKTEKPHANEVLETVVVRVPPPIVASEASKSKHPVHRQERTANKQGTRGRS